VDLQGQGSTPVPGVSEEGLVLVTAAGQELPGGRAAEEAVVVSTPGKPTLDLRQAVALALEGNFGIQASADGVQSARIAESTARARFYPKLTPAIRGSTDDRTFSLEASQRIPWSGGSLTGAASYRTTTRQDQLFPSTSDLRLTLSQPLLRGFGPAATRFELVNSRRSMLARERAYDLDRQRLAVDVTAAFFQVVKQRQLLAVARQSQERSLRLRVASDARLKVGLASKLDVLRADLQASQAESAAVAADSALETALERFRFVLGLPPTALVEPEHIRFPTELAPRPEPLDVLLARALQNRLDLQESRDQLEDARRSSAIARQNLLPRLDLNVGITRSGFGSTFSESLSEADHRVDFFVTTSYPLEQASVQAAKASAELELVSRQRALRQKQLEIEADVRAAVRDLERIRKSIELQRKGVELAEQQHRLATLRYERGLASNFDVVDAEQSVLSARTALVGLLTDFQVARVRLLRVTGELDVTTEFWL
jgi:outer membrane protein